MPPNKKSNKVSKSSSSELKNTLTEWSKVTKEYHDLYIDLTETINKRQADERQRISSLTNNHQGSLEELKQLQITMIIELKNLLENMDEVANGNILINQLRDQIGLLQNRIRQIRAILSLNSFSQS